MTDGDALLATILDRPADDLPRLVFADWLDDHGRPGRATLIRDQIATGAVIPVGQAHRGWLGPVARRWPRGVGGWEWHRGFPEVWHGPLDVWLAVGAAVARTTPVRRVVVTDRDPHPPADPRKPARTWLRDDDGVWSARPPEAGFLPPAIFDCLEFDETDFAMFDHARVYPTRDAAVEALSAACVRWATRESRQPTPRGKRVTSRV